LRDIGLYVPQHFEQVLTGAGFGVLYGKIFQPETARTLNLVLDLMLNKLRQAGTAGATYVILPRFPMPD
jgi:hypothetical protein